MELIEGIRAFVATAQTGSFTEAAEQLGISNRLTSKYVAQLESKLGVLLLQRTTRQVGVTPIGKEFLLRAPAILESLDELLGDVSEDARGLTGSLRISAPVTFGEMYLSSVLSQFSVLHPQLIIDLRLSDEHVDLAKEGFDLAFRVGEPELLTLKARKISEVQNVLVASADYLDKNSLPKTPKDLDMHQCIIDTNRRNAGRWVFHKEEEEYSFNPKKHLLVNSARVAKNWAMAGNGIALLPSFVLQDELTSHKLIQVLEAYSMKTNPFYAVYLSHNVLPKRVRALIDFAVDSFKGSI